MNSIHLITFGILFSAGKLVFAQSNSNLANDSLIGIIDSLKQVVADNESTIKHKDSIISRLSLQAKSISGLIDSTETEVLNVKKTEVDSPVNSTPTPVLNERILADLNKGYYVVVQSFRTRSYALRNLNTLGELGYKAMVVYDPENQWHYVYLERFENRQVALSEMRNVRGSGFKGAWVHVHD